MRSCIFLCILKNKTESLRFTIRFTIHGVWVHDFWVLSLLKESNKNFLIRFFLGKSNDFPSADCLVFWHLAWEHDRISRGLLFMFWLLYLIYAIYLLYVCCLWKCSKTRQKEAGAFKRKWRRYEATEMERVLVIEYYSRVTPLI